MITFEEKEYFVPQHNSLAHASLVAMAKIHKLGYELIDHPPYLPDLVPSNFFPVSYAQSFTRRDIHRMGRPQHT